MTSNEPTTKPNADRTHWWMFWRSVPLPLRRRRARLSDEANSDAAAYGIRGGF
jgi:hypothetical protein